MSENEPINEQSVLELLDGNVQSQGFRISHREWLDLGKAQKTPDEIKAAAYQAAKLTGWDDDALKSLMISSYPHVTDFIMDVTLNELRDLAEKHPLEVEQVYEANDDNVEIKQKEN